MTDTVHKKSWQDKAAALHFETRPFIGGRYIDLNESGEIFETVNPSTEEALAQFNDSTPLHIEQAVQAANTAFNAWRLCSPDKRKAYLFSLAEKIQAHRETLALMDSLEMGMPINQALDQIDESAAFLRYNAELIDKVYGEVAPSDLRSTLALSLSEPRGVVGIISPWNYPYATAMVAIAPALAAGNTLVIKPSEQTPSSILFTAQLSIEAGLPEGVINVVPGLGNTTGAALAKHPDVALLHFTGSVSVGRQLMVYAGQSNGKPVILELGGKSPQIVFEDATDIEGLGEALAQAAFYNTGQLCVAKTRLVVHQSIKEKLIQDIQKASQRLFVLGNPLEDVVTFGPLASRKQNNIVERYTAQAKEAGATLLSLPTSGKKSPFGFFTNPVIVDDVDPQMPIVQEEIFGPVLSVLTFTSEEQALQLANATDYGLSATVWTKELGRARRLARDIRAGDISIRSTAVAGGAGFSLSTEPFGNSGHGTVGGRRGLEPYLRTKAVMLVTD